MTTFLTNDQQCGAAILYKSTLHDDPNCVKTDNQLLEPFLGPCFGVTPPAFRGYVVGPKLDGKGGMASGHRGFLL